MFNLGETTGAVITRVESTIGAQRQWQQRFSYDALGRLSSAGEYRGDDLDQTYLLNYDYDVYGNRYQKSSRNPNNPAAQVWVESGSFSPTTNRLTSGVTYDEAGNVTSDSRFRNRALQYDVNNRQKQSSNLDGTGAVQSVYDGAGQRVAVRSGGVITNVMVYDAAGDLVAEYGGTVSANGTRYVMGDHQGSTRVVMSGAGAVVSRHDYLPFGEEVSAGAGMRTSAQGYSQADSVREKYAGMEGDDSTGMSHTLWREYDSLSARWTAPDPYGGSMSLASPQSFNRYAYVNNDPVNHVDPTGLMLSDIGVVQTDNPAVALRLERALDTVLRRYMEGQTGEAQRQQREQRRNAAFGNHSMPSSLSFSGGDGGAGAADFPEIASLGGTLPGLVPLTLRIKAHPGASLSRGNPLRFPGRRQTLGPAYLKDVDILGWQLEITGTTPDDVSTWEIYQDWETGGVVTDDLIGTFPDPPTTGRDHINDDVTNVRGAPYTYITRDKHRFYFIDAPGQDRDTTTRFTPYMHTVYNFTTYMKKGDQMRKIEWALDLTFSQGRMKGGFYDHHLLYPTQ